MSEEIRLPPSIIRSLPGLAEAASSPQQIDDNDSALQVVLWMDDWFALDERMLRLHLARFPEADHLDAISIQFDHLPHTAQALLRTTKSAISNDSLNSCDQISSFYEDQAAALLACHVEKEHCNESDSDCGGWSEDDGSSDNGSRKLCEHETSDDSDK